MTETGPFRARRRVTRDLTMVGETQLNERKTDV
jgi:hypothetical protein